MIDNLAELARRRSCVWPDAVHVDRRRGRLMVAHSEEVPPRSFAHGAVRGGDG
ncbi:hypothetical protein [Streptomyces sp. NPDC048192]|uniref:hypothetical protein n=1 Tax=Streptomyces sp. NPDC048192 TaxID=3365510 RepID=UPI0037195E70